MTLHSAALLTISDTISGDASATELTREVLERIERLDPLLHAYITVDADGAMRRARDLESQSRRGPLHGIALGFKDNIATAGLRTTANSRILTDWIPSKDATVVANLRAAGAVVVGKHNLNEFGWSLPAADDLTPAPRNPWDTTSAAIGSSSGSGAAVAAGLCSGALGTDSGGSVRLPAANCSVVGLKPTHGLLPLDGVFGVPTLSDVGVLARSVADVRLLLASAVAERNIPTHHSVGNDGLRLTRMGVLPDSDLPVDTNPEIAEAYRQAIHQLEHAGAHISEVSGIRSETAVAAVRVILNAEAFAGHASSLRRHPELYGTSARIHLSQGAFVSAADYINALRYMGRYAGLIDSIFESVDCLMTPTAPYLTAEEARQPDTHRRGGGDVFTSPFNLSGNPAVSVPAGFCGGMPIGVQMVARRGSDYQLLWIAQQFEHATPWHEQHPRLAIEAVS
jgi:aspartyl-tRNA(Asn)/glutamyl-tRNA(Gln) amidotransferase subunit A